MRLSDLSPTSCAARAGPWRCDRGSRCGWGPPGGGRCGRSGPSCPGCGRSDSGQGTCRVGPCVSGERADYCAWDSLKTGVGSAPKVVKNPSIVPYGGPFVNHGAIQTLTQESDLLLSPCEYRALIVKESEDCEWWQVYSQAILGHRINDVNRRVNS